MTTTTVFGNNTDAYVYANGAYPTAREGGAGAVDTSAPFFVGVEGASPSWFGEQSLEEFDTSSIPDTDTVSSASLDIRGDSTYTPSNTGDLEARSYDWGGTATTADWTAGSALTGLTHLFTMSIGSWNNAGDNVFTEQAGAAAWVNKTGFSRLMMHSAQQESATEPGVTLVSYTYLSARTGGTSNDPTLTVTHAAAGGAQDTPELAGRPFGRRGRNQMHQALAF